MSEETLLLWKSDLSLEEMLEKKEKEELQTECERLLERILKFGTRCLTEQEQRLWELMQTKYSNNEEKEAEPSICIGDAHRMNPCESFH